MPGRGCQPHSPDANPGCPITDCSPRRAVSFTCVQETGKATPSRPPSVRGWHPSPVSEPRPGRRRRLRNLLGLWGHSSTWGVGGFTSSSKGHCSPHLLLPTLPEPGRSICRCRRRQTHQAHEQHDHAHRQVAHAHGPPSCSGGRGQGSSCGRVQGQPRGPVRWGSLRFPPFPKVRPHPAGWQGAWGAEAGGGRCLGHRASSGRKGNIPRAPALPSKEKPSPTWKPQQNDPQGLSKYFEAPMPLVPSRIPAMTTVDSFKLGMVVGG